VSCGGGKLKLAAALGNEAIKRPVGNCQGLSSRIGLSVSAFAYLHSKMICKIIEFRYHARPKSWQRIDYSLYHLFSFLNAASSVALLMNALSSVAFLIRQIQN
jgi:hypothetical protein